MKTKFVILALFFVTIGMAQVNYLNFDGNNDFIQLDDHADLDFYGDFTIEMKFKRERDGIREDLMDKKKIAPGGSSFNDVAITIDALDHVVLWFKEDAGNTVLLTSSTVLEVGEWYHVASVREGTTVRLYLNGILEASGSFYGSVSSDGPMRIGSNRTINADPNSSPIFPFDGGIDEIRIWEYARTGDQISDYLDEELFGDESGLVRYLNLNQGVPCGENTAINYAIDLAADLNGELINFALSESGGDPCTSNWVGRNTGQNSIQETALAVSNCYPNPTTGLVVLIFDSAYYLDDLILYDLAGNLVLQKSMNTQLSQIEIDLSSLSTGQYMIFATTEEKIFYLTSIQKQ